MDNTWLTIFVATVVLMFLSAIVIALTEKTGGRPRGGTT